MLHISKRTAQQINRSSIIEPTKNERGYKCGTSHEKPNTSIVWFGLLMFVFFEGTALKLQLVFFACSSFANLFVCVQLFCSQSLSACNSFANLSVRTQLFCSTFSLLAALL